MDANKRLQLIARIKEQGLPGEQPTLPIVSLEDFFVGNDDYGSIGCNLSEHPGPQTFFNILHSISSRHDVQDVLIEIAEVDEQDVSLWPFSERVYILITATPEQVEEWVSELVPDDVGIGYQYGTPAVAPPLEAGMQVYSVWWD